MTGTDSRRFNQEGSETVSEAFGQALRAIRMSAGVSLPKLARGAAFSESHLRNVENGNRAATREIADACDRALGTGGILVDLFIADQDEDAMRRRAVLGALGTVVGLGVVDVRLVAESIRMSLLATLGVEDWDEVGVDYGRSFMSDSPTEFQARLSGDLLVLRQSMMESDSAQARLVAPRLMTLQGMVTANLGDAAGAARWYRAARLAADRTGDDTLRQWVRGREAFRRGYEGASPDEVRAIAGGVADIEAKLAVAQASARTGEDGLARIALDEARRIHEATDQSETTIYAMPPWRMALSSAHVYALMGDVTGCDGELRKVTPPPTVKRWESQLEMQRALAYAKAGDTAEGLHAARSVLRTISKEEHSIVLTEMYGEVKRCACRNLELN